MSLYEPGGLETRMFCKINFFFNKFSISLLGNISFLAEKFVSNFVSIAKKSSLQFSASEPEEEDRKSLSLVSFCQVAKCLPTQPAVKLITL